MNKSKLLSLILLCSITISLFIPDTAFASAPQPQVPIDVIFKIYNYATQTIEEVGSAEVLDIVASVEETGLTTVSSEYALVGANDTIIPITSYNYSYALRNLGGLLVWYELSQGANWVNNTSEQNREQTYNTIANNIISQYNNYNTDANNNIATILYNTMLDTAYYTTYGMPLSSAFVTSLKPFIRNFVSSSTIEQSYFTYLSIPQNYLLTLTQSQYNSIYTYSGVSYYTASGRYYIYPNITSASNKELILIYNPNNGKILYGTYNDTQGIIQYYTSYSATHGNGLVTNSYGTWSYSAGSTLSYQNLTYPTIEDFINLGTYVGRIFIYPDALPNHYYSLDELTKPTITTNPYIEGVEPQTMPSETILVNPFGDTEPTIPNPVDIPNGGDGDFPIVNKWFPIDPLSSIWHYVIKLVNVGNDFIVALGQIVNSLPTEIWYPFLGGFVLCLLGAVIHKLLG